MKQLDFVSDEMLPQKKKKKKKKGVPDRWLDYCPVGQRIPGTRFVTFKVPLKPSLNCQVPEADSFSLWDLLDTLQSQNQELGLIIDLTFTTRYYRLTDVPRSCSYIKIFTEGRLVPSDAAILSFKRAVRRFLNENRDNDRLIGVHCTHGLNRTGYLVCRYLIDVDGLDPPKALQLFNSCRGHSIERQNYLDDLQSATKRSNAGIDEQEEAAARGLAAERPPSTRKETRQLQAATSRPQGHREGRQVCESADTQQSNEKAAPANRRQDRRHDHHRAGAKCSDRTACHSAGAPPTLHRYSWRGHV